VIGVAEVSLDVTVIASAQDASSDAIYVAVGIDSTTAPGAGNMGMVAQGSVSATAMIPVQARLVTYPPIGRHTYVWLERGAASGATTWHGITAGPLEQNGIHGVLSGG